MRHQKRNSILTKYISYSIGIGFLFLVYFLISFYSKKEVLFPSFNEIGNEFVKIFTSEWQISFGYSLLRVVLSLIISLAISLFIAYIYYIFKPSYYFLKPLLYILKVSPILFIVLYVQVLTKGSSLAPYVVCCLFNISLMSEAYISAIDNIDEDLKLQIQLEKLSKTSIFFKIILPTINKDIYLSVIQTIGMSLKIIIMVEYFCTLKYGLGSYLYYYYTTINMAGMITLIIYVSVISAIFELLVYFINKIIFKSKFGL